MLIRVDEFPRCDPQGRRFFDPWAVLDGFMGILRAPFCLAVVVGDGCDEWATMNDIERLRGLAGLTLAAHGMGHRPFPNHDQAAIAALARLFPSRIAIPPFNRLNQPTVGKLIAAGFRHICTGPETRRDCPAIRFDGATEVPSAYYGYLCDSPALLDAAHPVPFGMLDCVTLHTCWESWATPRNEYLRRFADIYRGEIVSWDVLLKGTA